MTGNDNIPDLKDALDQTKPVSDKKIINPEDIPPPPRDWVSHPATRLISFLFLVGVAVFIFMKGPGWLEYLKEHIFGTVIVISASLIAIFIIIFGYWRWRAKGDVDMRYWDTERKKKPR